jgi:hypothetical protein
MSLATDGFSAMMSALGLSVDAVLELLLVDAFATRLPKFEPEMMFLIGKKDDQFKPNQVLVYCLPLFYY